MLPGPWQKQIWKHYRPGQEKDKNPSAIYMLTQRAAVGIVAMKEGTLTIEQVKADLRKWGERLWPEIDPKDIQAWPESPL